MRLINARTYKLETFPPSRIPPYVILSHTWDEDASKEISFQDLSDLDAARTKCGFSKIEMACKLALNNHIEYAWVDTCCIDKSSSAELSESLNSMFRWYEKARICYAYINDWPPDFDLADLAPLKPDEVWIDEDEDFGMQKDAGGDEISSENGYLEMEDRHDVFTTTPYEKDEDSQLRDDSEVPPSAGGNYTPCRVTISYKTSMKTPLRWFTRGWTLQELIAPCNVEFYDTDWNLRGKKQEAIVAEHILRITGIPSVVLGKDGKRALQEVCLGQRMSWAAYRETTREEDIAYSLLGIFQVNMPMLYGEGENAFFRLQEEIMKYSTDLSIFAWTEHYLNKYKQKYRVEATEEFSMTNKGLRFNVSLLHPAPGGTSEDYFGFNVMELGCLIDGCPQGIFRERASNCYIRILSDRLVHISSKLHRSKFDTIYVARDVERNEETGFCTDLAFGVKIDVTANIASYALAVVDVWPKDLFHKAESTFIATYLDTFTGLIHFAVTDKSIELDRSITIADFYLIVVYDADRFLTYALDGGNLTNFEDFTRSTFNRIGVTVLERYRSVTIENSKPEILVLDSRTNTLL